MGYHNKKVICIIYHLITVFCFRNELFYMKK